VKIENLANRNVKIEGYQSTFIVLNVEGEMLRFDFKKKVEFRLNIGTVGKLQYFQNHPLLIDYNENFVETFINSKPESPEKFIEEIKLAIDEKTLGWRSWKNYIVDGSLFKLENFIKNVNDGNGRLLKAPFLISQSVIKVCEKHKVKTNSFGSNLKTEKYKLITIENDFIIAQEFKLNNKGSH
jgi:hypothetical protein